MNPPRPASVRYRVEPGDVPAEKAARRLHLTIEEFRAKLPELQARGFPAADPTTGMYDLDEIDRWRARRHRPQGALTMAPGDSEPPQIGTMGERFRETKKRVRDDRAA